MLANEIGIGKGFKGAIRYNVAGKRDQPVPDKCAWIAARNLPDADPETAWRIMRATADLSARAERPVYHFSIDWRADEAAGLGRERMLVAAAGVLARLGLSEHQAIVFAHQDADHPHIHLVVNRVHPVTGRAWAHWRSRARLEQAVAEVAQEMGFLRVPGRHNGLQQDREIKVRPSRGEFRRARREGELALSPWSMEQMAGLRHLVAGAIHNGATNWQTIRQHLSAQGLMLRRKGQGFILTDGMGFMKLSELGRSLRLKLLDIRQTARGNDLETPGLGAWELLAPSEDRAAHIERRRLQHLSRLRRAIERLRRFRRRRLLQLRYVRRLERRIRAARLQALVGRRRTRDDARLPIRLKKARVRLEELSIALALAAARLAGVREKCARLSELTHRRDRLGAGHKYAERPGARRQGAPLHTRPGPRLRHSKGRGPGRGR